jgi:hypothetical protein
MQKCEKCLNSRTIISENGHHAVCCLSQKKAMDCIMGNKSSFISVKADKEFYMDLLMEQQEQM